MLKCTRYGPFFEARKKARWPKKRKTEDTLHLKGTEPKDNEFSTTKQINKTPNKHQKLFLWHESNKASNKKLLQPPANYKCPRNMARQRQHTRHKQQVAETSHTRQSKNNTTERHNKTKNKHRNESWSEKGVYESNLCLNKRMLKH